MALTERQEVASMTVDLKTGDISVRTDTVIERDGVEIARSSHREVTHAGDPVFGTVAAVSAVVVTQDHVAKRVQRDALDKNPGPRVK